MVKKLIAIIFVFTLSFPAIVSAAEPNEPYKILIVPGHDSETWGTEFRKVKEANMNMKLALLLADSLKKNKKFQVSLTRDWDNYTEEFGNYFENNKDSIKLFTNNSKEDTKQAKEAGQFGIFTDNVPHDSADSTTAFRLYGINKWANENAPDAVVHIHFNDYPRPKASERGKYEGFAVYFPESALKNSRSGFALGAFVFQELIRYYKPSNYPPESLGLVPDQELIALGANNTLDPAAILVEYGYIYEKRFSTFAKRDKELRIMAKATVKGLENYFNYLEKK